jgi:histidinol-phosphate aminotransferase
MAAADDLLAEFDKVRPPYNVNVLTQTTAEFLLEHVDVLDQQAVKIRQERERMSALLKSWSGVQVIPSHANFLLIRITAPNLSGSVVFERLLAQKVLIKNVGKMHPLLANCLRITVSTPAENALFEAALKISLQP